MPTYYEPPPTGFSDIATAMRVKQTFCRVKKYLIFMVVTSPLHLWAFFVCLSYGLRSLLCTSKKHIVRLIFNYRMNQSSIPKHQLSAVTLSVSNQSQNSMNFWKNKPLPKKIVPRSRRRIKVSSSHVFTIPESTNFFHDIFFYRSFLLRSIMPI